MHYAIDQTRPLEATVRYLVDGKGSRFTARAFATGLLSAFGHDPTIAIPEFEGEARVNLNALEESSLHLVIQAASLTVTDDINDKDRNEIDRRMHDEVLESDGYPEITYECSKLSSQPDRRGPVWVALNGELSTARGHPKPADFGAGDGQWRYAAGGGRFFRAAE